MVQLCSKMLCGSWEYKQLLAVINNHDQTTVHAWHSWSYVFGNNPCHACHLWTVQLEAPGYLDCSHVSLYPALSIPPTTIAWFFWSTFSELCTFSSLVSPWTQVLDHCSILLNHKLLKATLQHQSTVMCRVRQGFPMYPTLNLISTQTTTTNSITFPATHRYRTWLFMPRSRQSRNTDRKQWI